MAPTRQEIEARRAKRRKAAQIKRLKVLTVAFLIIAVVTVAILSVTVFFPIKKINVSGSKKYDAETIIEQSALMGENLIITSERKLEENLRKKLPYIDEISLKKDMPDTVSIKITDAKEYASYKVSGKYYVVSRKGYVLRTSKTLPDGTIEIITKAKATKNGEKIQFSDKKSKKLTEELMGYLNEHKIKINSINLKNKSRITVRVEGRFDVSFGTVDFLERKCAHLAKMIDEIDKDARGDINLSMWTPDKTEGTLIRENAEQLSEDLLKYLEDNELKIDNVDASDENNIMAKIEGKYEVNFGNSDHLKEKCEYLADMINGISEAGTIDLSKWTPDNQQFDFQIKK